MKRLNIGCGKNILSNYINIDIMKLPGVDIIAKSDSLPIEDNTIDHIYSRHHLEHLFPSEAVSAVKEWNRVLKSKGTIEVIVPNMDKHCKQWLSRTNMKHAAAGFWGWQRSDYDLHKSGYYPESITKLFADMGFTNIETNIRNELHLVLKGKKR